MHNRHHEGNKPTRLEVLEETKDDILAIQAANILRIAQGDVNRMGIDASDGVKELIIVMAMKVRDLMKGVS
jgi:hypothetical protein